MTIGTMETMSLSWQCTGVLSVCSFVRGASVDVDVWLREASDLAFSGDETRHKTSDGTVQSWLSPALRRGKDDDVRPAGAECVRRGGQTRRAA